MRHLISPFLALHWAVVFALLAFVCLGGSAGIEDVLATFGGMNAEAAPMRFGGMATAALASAFLIVSALFSWALIEAFLGESEEGAEGVFKIGFAAAGAVLLLLLVYGTAQGIEGLFLPSAVHVCALSVSYLAVTGECAASARLRHSPTATARLQAHAMARGAAHASLLSRISRRTDSGAQP